MKALKRIFWTDYKRTQERATAKHVARMSAKRERGIKPFLAYEDAILTRYWPAEGDAVNKRMDRPLHAIHRRVKELRLSRLPEVSRWSMPESCVGWMTGWLGRRFA